MTVRSLRYMVVAGWMDEGRTLCRWPQLGCANWEWDREARTLAAAEAAELGGMKWWSRPCSPEAVRTGWARTLAKILSGCKQQHVNTEQPHKKTVTSTCYTLVEILTPVADSLECSEVQRGASESSSWVEGPPCASWCTFSFRWLINTELSWGGCQCGFLMVKCMRDSSVFPFSACWYMEASVWPSDIHCKKHAHYLIVSCCNVMLSTPHFWMCGSNILPLRSTINTFLKNWQ